MPLFGSVRRGLTSRDAIFLVIAIVIHAGFLLVPVRTESPVDTSADTSYLRIQLELHRNLAVELPMAMPEPEPEPLDPISSKPVLESPPNPSNEWEAQNEIEAVPEPSTPGSKEKTYSAAVLLRSAVDQDWLTSKEQPHLELGKFVPQPMPENWRPHILVEENRFDGMTVPQKVEVVDRWISADGSRNVVLNTPTGHTLCGRAAAWDPMQPLVEHVMQFGTCPGGGERTFEMPDRYRKKTGGLSGVMNSTTN